MFLNHSYYLAKQFATVDAFIFRVGIRKVVTDITECQRSQQCIAQGVNSNIRIAMSQQTAVMLKLYATQPQFAPFHKAVNVESLTYSH